MRSDLDGDESDNSLIIDTEYVSSYGKIFDNLDLNFSTNMKGHDKSFERKSKSKSKSQSQSSRRKLQWSLSDIWSDVVDGVEVFLGNVDSLISTIEEDVTDWEEDVSTVISALEGNTVSRNGSATDELWSYSYSGNYLDSDNYVKCTSCYASLDLTFTYKFKIESETLVLFSCVATGTATMEVDIDLTHSWSYEWDGSTTKIPVPYLSFDVFGITFGFDIYGALAIGVNIDIDFSIFGGKATGSISRGIEYTPSNGISYISNDNSFSYSINGPELLYTTADITVYAKPTLYLELDYIGNVYFGIQSEVTFNLVQNR